MTPREFAAAAGIIWTRRERRSLARAAAAPGRRLARRWPLVRELAFSGFTRANIEAIALLAVPGLRRGDVRASSPEPGRVRVEIDTTKDRMVDALFDAQEALRPHVPIGIELEVTSYGWPNNRSDAASRGRDLRE